VAKLIDPRTMSGFRDYPPDLMIPRERVLETARRVYRSYGFAPIDTPACEALDVLLGKGGGENDRLVYRVKSAKSEVEEMGLRFDLTVPFARFSAQHVAKLGTPFKRYAMGPVWRGERPGHGRYREFWQCDFDTIGTTSNAADIETALVICDLFEGLGFGDKFELRINNRLVLNGLLEHYGLLQHSTIVLRALDKLQKIGREKVVEEICSETNVASDVADKIVASIEKTGTNEGMLQRIEEHFGRTSMSMEGVAKLRELLAACGSAGISQGRIKIDLSICRGLDYYTGTIFETFLSELPGIGSVCSGGRYDNLASVYTKQVLPGVGASLGVDRLLAAMEELKHPWLTGATTPVRVICLNLDAKFVGAYQKAARELRAAGVGVEVYPDAKKLGPQFQYAEKRGFRLALIAGEDEFTRGVWKVKDLVRREETEVKAEDLVESVRMQLPN
jgi:histidyl-tRNA synthetase